MTTTTTTTTTTTVLTPSSSRSSSRHRSADSPRLSFARETRRQSSNSSPKPRNTAPRLRQSSRVRKQSTSSSRPSSRPSTPSQAIKSEHEPGTVIVTSSNELRRAPNPVTHVFSLADNIGPLAHWDAATHVVSNQEIESTYSKEQPTTTPDGRKIYGRLVTKTVTVTVSTTIATTEIVHPDEGVKYINAYEQQQNPRVNLEKYHVSRKEAAGYKDYHEEFHRQHHRSALPNRLKESE
ncbi:hypothetical protein EX30DRAFT_234588 [Ascodesmis nigricans]|uniref:Uncharacterized protein n=1 Tax=Ascodesmis nigricans TaxID=341454 RepID=A0A4V3SIW7_9PEZI|nr:hypothetical protein EX30DRAFT_234588 [Ascodesmis nigricans]